MKLRWIGIGLAAVFIVSGCTARTEGSPEAILSSVLESQKSIGSYYAEGTMRLKEANEIVEETFFKEWSEAGSGKRRTEMKSPGQELTTVNDGTQVISYDKTNGSAFSYKLTDDDKLASATQREQLANLLKWAQSTHKTEVAGEEKLLGMNTYHMKVSANTPDTMMGDMEFWVDQKTWFMLRSLVVTGTSVMETDYTKVDFSPKFSNETFTLKPPAYIDVKDLGADNFANEVSTSEAEKDIGQPFLMMNESEFKLTKTEKLLWQGELKREEIIMYYVQNDVPAVTLTVFPLPKDAELSPAELTFDVRQTKGHYIEEIRTLTWDEGSLRYSLSIDHPDLSLDKVADSLTRMKLSSEH